MPNNFDTVNEINDYTSTTAISDLNITYTLSSKTNTLTFLNSNGTNIFNFAQVPSGSLSSINNNYVYNYNQSIPLDLSLTLKTTTLIDFDPSHLVLNFFIDSSCTEDSNWPKQIFIPISDYSDENEYTNTNFNFILNKYLDFLPEDYSNGIIILYFKIGLCHKNTPYDRIDFGSNKYYIGITEGYNYNDLWLKKSVSSNGRLFLNETENYSQYDIDEEISSFYEYGETIKLYGTYLSGNLSFGEDGPIPTTITQLDFCLWTEQIVKAFKEDYYEYNNYNYPCFSTQSTTLYPVISNSNNNYLSYFTLIFKIPIPKKLNDLNELPPIKLAFSPLLKSFGQLGDSLELVEFEDYSRQLGNEYVYCINYNTEEALIKITDNSGFNRCEATDFLSLDDITSDYYGPELEALLQEIEDDPEYLYPPMTPEEYLRTAYPNGFPTKFNLNNQSGIYYLINLKLLTNDNDIINKIYYAYIESRNISDEYEEPTYLFYIFNDEIYNELSDEKKTKYISTLNEIFMDGKYEFDSTLETAENNFDYIGDYGTIIPCHISLENNLHPLFSNKKNYSFTLKIAFEDIYSNYGSWYDDVIYNINDEVIYEDSIWRSTINNNSSIPGVDDNWVWEKIAILSCKLKDLSGTVILHLGEYITGGLAIGGINSSELGAPKFECYYPAHFYGQTFFESAIHTDGGISIEWEDLTVESGVTNPSTNITGARKLQVGRVGNHAYIRGQVDVAGPSSGNKIIASLPSEYVPSYPAYSWGVFSGSHIAKMFVLTSGDFGITAVYNISDGARNTTKTWLDCNFNYWLD